MTERNTAFQIDIRDNVATALVPLEAGEVVLLGESQSHTIIAVETIPVGHKISLSEIHPEEHIVKYGISIGKATTTIPPGSWVHLHCISSIYDERSNHLDKVTGAPADIKYE
jgi:altronate dehydratase small subunit